MYNPYQQYQNNFAYSNPYNRPEINNQYSNNKLEIVKVNGENVDQSTMNEAVQKAVQDIHNHLTEQDEKINAIMGKLGIKKGEE